MSSLRTTPEPIVQSADMPWVPTGPGKAFRPLRNDLQAKEPEDVTRLVVERLNAGDAEGAAALYEPNAVLAYPVERPTTGRDAIRAVYQKLVDAGVKFGLEAPLPTVRFENLALASTRSADNTGLRVQVLRQQPDGSWLRIIDRPEA
jgi:ketosteroid isomerase-like protein